MFVGGEWEEVKWKLKEIVFTILSGFSGIWTRLRELMTVEFDELERVGLFGMIAEISALEIIDQYVR